MRTNILKDSKFLIVDDQVSNVELLERIFRRAGYHDIVSTTDSHEFLNLYYELQPDIVLLDLHMPNLDGFELLTALKSLIPENEYVPILVLTADTTPGAKRKALSAGAKDFITKPLNPTEVLLRVNNLLETRILHVKIHGQNQDLEIKVAERTHKLELAQFELLRCLAKATEYRDDATGEHTQRVGELSARLAHSVGMDPETTEMIRLAAPLHDVGKIGVPDTILLKPGKLTEEEFGMMKHHTLIGKEILSDMQFPILKLAGEITLTHHECWDGSGYPNGLKGDQIPLAGQIVSLVDMFDALTHRRPYKPAWSVAEALAEIEKQKGKKFNPELVEAFLKMMKPSLAAEIKF